MEMLRFDGVNDFVLPALSSSVNWGVDVWGIKFGAIIRRHPASGNEGIVGSNVALTAGITLRQASGDGAAALITAGTFRVASSAGYLELDVYHDYYIYRDAGGTIHWERDGTDFSTSAFNTSATHAVRGFGRANTSGGFALMDLAYIELIGFTNSEVWRADLTDGTGSTLPTVSGNNLGTLTNFPTDNSQWIGFGGGAAYNDTLSGVTYTYAAGSLTSSVGKNDTLSGASYSASIGSLVSALGFNDTLNGATYSGAVGDMIAARGRSSELSGATYSAEVGSLSSLRGYSSLLSAADYGAAIGELISTLDGATAYSDLLSGIVISAALGDLVSSVQRASILNGLAYGFSVGDFTSSLGYNSALSGVNYSSSIGQLTSTLSGEVTVTIEGYTIRFADSAVAAVYADDSISVIYAN